MDGECRAPDPQTSVRLAFMAASPGPAVRTAAVNRTTQGTLLGRQFGVWVPLLLEEAYSRCLTWRMMACLDSVDHRPQTARMSAVPPGWITYTQQENPIFSE